MNIKSPPRDILNSLIDILEEKEVKIPQANIEMVTAVFCHWLENEKRGHEYMAYLLRLNATKGKSEEEYILTDPHTGLTTEILPETIVFLEGCVANGKVIPLAHLDIYDRETDVCDNCGGHSSCVSRNSIDRCSYCAGFSEYPDDQYKVALQCNDCTDQTCHWHPLNNDLPHEGMKHYGDLL